MRSASVRASVSVVPPGVKLIRKRTGFDGNACGDWADASAA
jgi:hypothetical protein